jgi:DNA-directed RNA polymerase subunit M/transcription elongation factor TFIIS
MGALQKVIDIRNRLKAVTSANGHGFQCDKVLSDLCELEQIQLDREMLSSTRIAGVIGWLRAKSSDSSVKAKANYLFEKWARALKDPQTTPSPMQSGGGDAADLRRKKQRDILHEELNQWASKVKIKPRFDPDKIAGDIENEIFLHEDSERRFLMLIGALTEPKKIEEFRFAEKLLTGELNAVAFARLEAEDLLTEDRRNEIRRNREIARSERSIPKPQETKSTLFKCPQCESRNVTYYQLQILSADEPITNFCRCWDCGHEWRE